jgi:hypothetical protein
MRGPHFSPKKQDRSAGIILEIGRHKPYKALASFLPVGTLVVGHHDLSTGGVAETTPISKLLT